MATEKEPFTAPSSTDDRKKIKQAVKEASNHRTHIESHNDGIKSIFDNLKEQFPTLDRTTFNGFVTTFHKQSLEEERQKSEDKFDNYDIIMG